MQGAGLRIQDLGLRIPDLGQISALISGLRLTEWNLLQGEASNCTAAIVPRSVDTVAALASLVASAEN